MHFRDIPFLRLTVPLIGGVITAEYLPGVIFIASALLIITLVIMTVRLFSKTHLSDMIFGPALVILLLTTGYILGTVDHTRLSNLDDKRQEVILRLTDYPDRGNSGCSIRGKILVAVSGDSVTQPVGSMLLWFMSDTIPSGWKPGDLLQVNTRPVEIENNGNPCEFNYRRYMEGKGIKYMAFFRAADIRGYQPATHYSFQEKSLITARRMTEAYRKAGLQGESLGLVVALTMGDKELLDRARLTTFSRSGAMHIMAVSGLHVGMISIVLSSLLFFLKGRLRWIRVLIIVTVLWGFAFITGLSPSVLRATIMFSFLQAGTMLNRPAASMNTLLASAFIITAAHPSVIFEAGFQLSYLAVGFILTFFYPLCRLVRIKNRVARYFWQMTALSLVAQAGTMALSIRLFNIFPLLFLVSNIVVIPVTFVVLVLAMLLLVTSPFPPLASLFALLLDRLAGFTLGFTGIISSMDNGVITDIGMSAPETVMMTISLALLLAALLRTGRLTLKPFLFAASILLLCNTTKTIQEQHQERVITYNIRGKSLTATQHGRFLLVPVQDGGIPPEIRKHALTRGLKIKPIEPG